MAEMFFNKVKQSLFEVFRSFLVAVHNLILTKELVPI